MARTWTGRKGTAMMSLFKELTEEEAVEYRQWARDNYKPFTEIKGVWHPAVQAECVAMNAEADLEPELREVLGDDLDTILGGSST
jgi:hypothetical protein